MTASPRWWFAAFVVAVFFAGTSVGVIVDRVWLLPRTAAMPPGAGAGPQNIGPGGRGQIIEANLRRLRNRLELTSEQTEQTRPILEAWQQRVGAIQTGTRQQLLIETQRFEEELSPVLTPGQRERLASARSVLLVPATGRGRLGGPDDGRGGRGPGRAAAPEHQGTGRGRE